MIISLLNQYILKKYRELSKVFLVVLLLLGILIRVLIVDWSLSVDELEQIIKSRIICKNIFTKDYLISFNTIGFHYLIVALDAIFGRLEFLYRLFFVSFAILPIFISYKLFKKWFNNYVAIFVVLCWGFLNYPLTHALKISPVNISLSFFLLFLLYFYHKTEGGQQVLNLKALLLLSLIGLLSCIFSYSCWVMILGFWLICQYHCEKNVYKSLSITILLLNILYIPQVYLLFRQYQFQQINPYPEIYRESIWDFLFFTLNESLILLAILISIFVFFLILFKIKINPKNKIILALGLSLLVSATFFKSWNLPLKYTDYFYPFIPFFFAFFLSIIDEYPIQPYINIRFNRDKLRLSFCYVLFFTFLYLSGSALSAFQYIKNTHYQVVSPTVAQFKSWYQKYSKINGFVTFAQPDLVNYFFDKNFTPYFVKNKKNTLTFQQLQELLDESSQSKNEFFTFMWAGTDFIEEIPEIIKIHYPYLVEEYKNQHSGAFLFSNNPKYNKYSVPLKVYSLKFTNFDYKNYKKDWQVEDTVIQGKVYYSPPSAVYLNRRFPYGPTTRIYLDNFPIGDTLLLRCSAQCLLPDTSANAMIAIALKNDFSSDSDLWSPGHVNHFCFKPDEWFPYMHTLRLLPHQMSPSSYIEILCWASDGKPVFIDDLRIEVANAHSYRKAVRR